MPLTKKFYAHNFRNAFLLNSFTAALIAIVAINSKAFFDRLLRHITQDTQQLLQSLKKAGTTITHGHFPRPTPSSPPKVDYVSKPEGESEAEAEVYTEVYAEANAEANAEAESEAKTITVEGFDASFNTISSYHPTYTTHYNKATIEWLHNHLPFLHKLAHHNWISTLATFLFTFLTAFVVYTLMNYLFGYGGSMLTSCVPSSCIWK